MTDTPDTPETPRTPEPETQPPVAAAGGTSASSSSEAEPTRSAGARLALTALGTILGAAASVLMIGPQLLVIVPGCLAAGLFLTVRRMPVGLMLLGYPLMFGLLSAVIGSRESDDYVGTTPFLVSAAVGAVGVLLFAAGLFGHLSRPAPPGASGDAPAA